MIYPILKKAMKTIFWLITLHCLYFTRKQVPLNNFKDLRETNKTVVKKWKVTTILESTSAIDCKCTFYKAQTIPSKLYWLFTIFFYI